MTPPTTTKTKLVLHMLTAFPTHNVNRDEDGRPKTALLGGHLRGRVSSQAKKRALRFSSHSPDGQRAIRTRELGVKAFRALMLPGEGALDEISAAWIALAINHAIGGGGKSPQRAVAADIVEPAEETGKSKNQGARPATKAKGAESDNAGEGGGNRTTTGKRTDRIQKLVQEKQMSEVHARLQAIEEELITEQSLVVSTQEVKRLDALVEETRRRTTSMTTEQRDEEVDRTVKTLEKGGLLGKDARDLDLALFGRMVASLPGCNIEAAASVGHAITTHRFSVEADYFTAGEELNVMGGTGAAYPGYAFFGSGVYYQHAVLDYDALALNLGGRRDLAREGVQLFLRGLVHAQPGGKRNAFASDTSALYVLARRTTAPTVNLGFAFLDAVSAWEEGASGERDGDLARLSIHRLDTFDAALANAYAWDGERCVFNAYPPARSTKTPPKGEVWSFADLEAFALAGLGGAA